MNVIENRKIDTLIAYENNSRTHSHEQVKQIANSIKHFGFVGAILITPDGMIIAGHGRVMACTMLGMDEVPCMVADGWSDNDIRAYVIADNRLAEKAGWDKSVLKLELAALDEDGFSIGVTGFTIGDAGGLKLSVTNDANDEPKNDGGEFERRSFVLHHDQTEDVDDAISAARALVIDEGINDNALGNALVLICRDWLRLKQLEN